MKTIYFIRHAKSSWEDTSLRDFDRPLNQRGLRDAPRMATYLKNLGVQVDAIITSPANRARSTAKYFRKALEVAKKDFYLEEHIYEAYTRDVFKIVQNISNKYETVLLFGHNPTFTTIANRFTDDFIANIPTCGIVKIVCDIDKWDEFEEGKGQLEAFYYPKMLN